MIFFQHKGSATITNIPIGSSLFSAQHAVKKLGKSKSLSGEVVLSDTIPTTPTPATSGPASFHHPPYVPFPPSPYGFPSYYPYPLPNFFGPPSVECADSSGWGNPPPQPPSSPPPAESSLNDFCNDYDISFATQTKLDQLGFEMGDDLSSISEAQYESVGFKHLEWGRVLKAYRKFKRDRK
jgi:hypothetical protein